MLRRGWRRRARQEENQRGGPATRPVTSDPSAAPTPQENEPTKGMRSPKNQPAAPKTRLAPTAKATRPPVEDRPAASTANDVAGSTSEDPRELLPELTAFTSRRRRSMSSSAMLSVCRTRP